MDISSWWLRFALFYREFGGRVVVPLVFTFLVCHHPSLGLHYPSVTPLCPHLLLVVHPPPLGIPSCCPSFSPPGGGHFLVVRPPPAPWWFVYLPCGLALVGGPPSVGVCFSFIVLLWLASLGSPYYILLLFLSAMLRKSMYACKVLSGSGECALAESSDSVC